MNHEFTCVTTPAKQMVGPNFLFVQAGYSSPAQDAIREDLSLSLAEVS